MYSLKLIQDILFYWCLAIFFMFFVGSSFEVAISVICISLTYLLYRVSLRLSERLSFIKYLLMPLLFIPPFFANGIFGRLIVTLPSVYVLNVMHLNKDAMDNGDDSERMLYKILGTLLMQLFGSLIGKGFAYLWVFAAFLVLTLVRQRLYHLYSYGEMSKKVVLIYSVASAGFILLSVLLGHPSVWHFAFKVLLFVANFTIKPLFLLGLTIFAYIMIAVFYAIAWIFDLFNKDLEWMPAEQDMFGGADFTDFTEVTRDNNLYWVKYVLIALLILAICFIAFKLFSSLKGRIEERAVASISGVVKRSTGSVKKKEPRMRGNRASIRRSYKKVLRRLRLMNYTIDSHMTTEDVENFFVTFACREDFASLTKLYRKARYDEREDISRKEVKEAELLSKKVVRYLEEI